MAKTIALLTDFGTQDVYVGVMKAVIRGICADAELIDITHHVEAQSVREGAIALRNSYAYFPKDTVFLVVVDPGVGSMRRPVAVRAGDYWFVAPDNGVLSYALAEIGHYEAVMLENQNYHLNRVSATFHGRDVFAPTVGYLARGDVPLSAFGRTVPDLHDLPFPPVQIDENRAIGEVVHVDHFGNIITSVGVLRWVSEGRLSLTPLEKTQSNACISVDNAVVEIHEERIYGVQHAYYEVPRGQLLAQIDSNGYLEVAINQGDASKRLGVSVGDIVTLRWSDES